MSSPIKLFQSLTLDEKIDFFLRCQKLLVENHPNSSFIFREDNIQERLLHAKTMNEKYNGLVYCDDNVCVLFNKVLITDDNPINALKNNQFKPPVDNYNAVTIDFVVFKKLIHCAEWIKNQYDPKIQKVVYVKNGKPQIYPTAPFIARVLNLPNGGQFPRI